MPDSRESGVNIETGRRDFMKSAAAAVGSTLIPLETPKKSSSVSSMIASRDPGEGSGFLTLSREGSSMLHVPLDDVPEDHIFEKIADPIPEPDFLDSPLHEDNGEYSENRSEVWERIVEVSGNDPEKAWDLLAEDAHALKSSKFEYADERDYRDRDLFDPTDGELYIEVSEIEQSELRDVLEQGFYFGESFDAWISRGEELNSRVYDAEALLIFRNGSEPEDFLDSDHPGDDRDGEVMEQIYSASDRSKENYDFNFSL